MIALIATTLLAAAPAADLKNRIAAESN